MQKHAMALGYFFLSVFCLLTSTFPIGVLQVPLLAASLLALLAGFGYLCSALSAQIRACARRLTKTVRLAQQPPIRESVSKEERSL